MTQAQPAPSRPGSALPAVSILLGLASPAIFYTARQLTPLIDRTPGDETLFYVWLLVGLTVVTLAALGLALGLAALTRSRGARAAASLGVAVNLAWIGTMAFHVVLSVVGFQGR